ncbi:hypothetical protein CBR_g36742 [Chara braunii]|uniref:Uncharacterized protein n=1 Tax=Chara braunii TaxID=69332 RepID=A0A388LLE1_CHABU|nr:hypothetical protein CBR_g36742 [Chara braunii]|eukprot:GBG83124.1 hypothetical protein CBR_g36742 [Chara braunii]
MDRIDDFEGKLCETDALSGCDPDAGGIEIDVTEAIDAPSNCDPDASGIEVDATEELGARGGWDSDGRAEDIDPSEAGKESDADPDAGDDGMLSNSEVGTDDSGVDEMELTGENERLAGGVILPGADCDSDGDAGIEEPTDGGIEPKPDAGVESIEPVSDAGVEAIERGAEASVSDADAGVESEAEGRTGAEAEAGAGNPN